MGVPSRIFLVEDHPVILDGLRRLVAVSPEWMVCGDACAVAGAFDRIPKAAPDLVVVDISLPDGNGFDLIADLHRKSHAINFLVFSMHDDPGYAVKAFHVGAKGFLAKSSGPAQLANAFGRILRGEHFLSFAMTAEILRKFNQGEAFRKKSVTSLEWQVFLGIGASLTNSEIAVRLDISPRAVDARRTSLREKLGIEDPKLFVREAAIWAEVNRNHPNVIPV